jgi:ribosomal protein L15
MKLHELKPAPRLNHRPQAAWPRVGSGLGQDSGKGPQGAKAVRAGGKRNPDLKAAQNAPGSAALPQSEASLTPSAPSTLRST